MFSACSDGGSGNESDSAIGNSAAQVFTASCNAIETFAGASRKACVITECARLENTYFFTYDEKSDTDSCPVSGVVGICTTSDFETYYYEGDLPQLQADCKFNIGTCQ